ncbi:VolA/Pla-1 family phospholipase [Shewanella sp. 10N.286.48.A6]|uniref:VolA/Pla-1 family phospholipase n=1 Tax=Shewanella sp. 10N.286.48.A6 TaxID=1880833 RepID=UPI000C8501D8|nr:VolA/Pla-1 family phospholipase [Shewanella sp. 10N.286.48.A6]PMI01772.1 lipase [Shewanella sp. 10N.286.48.A6]
MKRLILGVAIASALGLSGCSEDSSNEAKDNVETLIPFSQVVFDPAAGDVPLPNDLLFNGTLDGTLAIPGEDGIDYVDPSLALGALDGWSTSSPISLSVDLATDSDGAMLTLDEASVSQPGAVRLFEATVGGALSSDPECSDAPSVSACKVGDELQFGVDFVALASGNKIAIVPLKPLKANQSYIYATTTLVQDSAGRAVEPSSTYNLLKLDIDTKPLETPDQLFLQGLVNSYEKGLAAEHGVDAETISYSGLFTTQSVADVYETSKLLMASSDPYKPSFVQPPMPMDNGFGGTVTVAQAAGLTPADGLAYVVSDIAEIYTAVVRLPFYGDCSSASCVIPIVDGAPTAPNGRWFAQGDSPVSVLLALQAGTMSQANFGQQAVAQGVDPAAALQNPALMAGKTWLLDADADGNRAAADPSKHLTKFNPIPKIMGYEDVTVQITLPNAAKLAAFSAQAGLPFVAPTNGWPTTMALHGLGGTKQMALAYAGTYAAAGIATIAIDMPLHGDRSYDADGDGIYDISATSDLFGPQYAKGNPLVFVNVASTLTVRDNFRQATMDHLGLRLLLTGMYSQIAQTPGATQVFDISKISAQGLSLGGIVGTTVSTYASTGLVNPTDGSALPNAYAINAASLVAPSGGLAGSFAGSATFGPVLFDTVTATDDFMDLVDEANVGDFEPSTLEYAALVQAVYAEFIPTFAFAVQTAVDSADPINHASMLADTQLPVHLIEAVGDGAGNLSDRVLPNQVEGFPLSGTEPLIAAMGLDCVSSTNAGSGAVRFSKGHHSSIVSPAEIDGVTDGMAAAATVEMQSQVAAFAKSAGLGAATILVDNDEVLQACE